MSKTIMIAHSWSDVSLNLQSKALALAFSKHNKVIFLSARKTGAHTVLINEHLVIHEWPGKRPVGWKDLLFAVQKIKQYKPDIILTNFAANDIMLFVSWLFGVKTRVCYFHTMVEQYIADQQVLDFRQRVNIFRKGFVFRMATHMLPSTNASKKDLIKYYKVDPGKAFVFPNALADTEYRNTGQNNTIGFLGRLDRSKGVDILIEAFKIMSDSYPNARLTIAGTGKNKQALIEKAGRLVLDDKIFFKGAIPYEKVPAFLASLHFLVVPSRTDNLPTVALEALSVGTPIIGSTAGGIPDIIEDGCNGLLFESENAAALSQKMISLFENISERNRISLNARKSFEEKYCINDLLPRFEALIEQNG